MNLRPELVQAVTERGYTNPTPIQSSVIPLMLSRQDVIGQAQTGTGNTAAFMLPILHNLTPNQEGVQSLIMAPTRELAIQVADFVYEYGQFHGVRVMAVYSGRSYNRQIRRLKSGVDVVVGTPGRLLDLIKKSVLDISRIDTVVLDEADEMLSMGFIEDIEAILKETPPTHQTALFSATISPEIHRLADRYMQDPESVNIDRKQRSVPSIEQHHCLVNEKDKLAALTRVMEFKQVTSMLIFTRTRVRTGKLANELSTRGFAAEALNGDWKPSKAGRKRSQRGIDSHEAGMVRLTFSRGKAYGVRPNDVVGTIAHHANIPGYTIGKIKFQEKRTLVDVPEKFVQQVLDKSGEYEVQKHHVTIERANIA